MSGESLRAMTLREVSSVTVVLNGGKSSRLCQPSSKATRASASKRPLALDCAPRPRRRSRSIATSTSGKTASSAKGVAPAGSEGAVTARVADVAGCRFLAFEGPRAAALAAGARAARSPWLMFLHAGAVLDSGWIEETGQFIQGVSTSGRPRAGIFRYARSPYSDAGFRDGLKFVARMITGPSAEQGLLIPRDHYDRLGGYP